MEVGLKKELLLAFSKVLTNLYIDSDLMTEIIDGKVT